MGSISGPLFGLLIVACLFYVVFIRPKIEKAREDSDFDSRVLAFVEGLRFSGLDLRAEILRYVEDQLERAHKLPGNQALIEYTTEQGWCYRSWTGEGDHMLFAVICIAQFGKESGDDELVSWCESMMEDARRAGIRRTV